MEDGRRNRQGSKAGMQSRRKGGRQGRAEDTAAKKPVICQISHGHTHINIMPLNRKKNNVKQYSKDKPNLSQHNKRTLSRFIKRFPYCNRQDKNKGCYLIPL